MNGEHGVWSTLSAESACKIFVFLGMVNHSASFEGCDVEGNPKTSYFLYVMMATVLLSFVLGLLWWSIVVFSYGISVN